MKRQQMRKMTVRFIHRLSGSYQQPTLIYRFFRPFMKQPGIVSSFLRQSQSLRHFSGNRISYTDISQIIISSICKPGIYPVIINFRRRGQWQFPFSLFAVHRNILKETCYFFHPRISTLFQEPGVHAVFPLLIKMIRQPAGRSR